MSSYYSRKVGGESFDNLFSNFHKWTFVFANVGIDNVFSKRKGRFLL